MTNVDIDQNKRILNLETRLNDVENSLSAITAQIQQATNILKAVAVVVGVTLGIDVQGMVV